jgi:hypothetical protein
MFLLVPKEKWKHYFVPVPVFHGKSHMKQNDQLLKGVIGKNKVITAERGQVTDFAYPGDEGMVQLV